TGRAARRPRVATLGGCRTSRRGDRQPVPATLTTRRRARVQETGRRSGAHGSTVTGTTSRVDLGADAEVEADRLEDVERGAVRVDVGGGEDAGVLLDDRRGSVGDLRRLVRLDRGPAVVAVPG